MEYKNLEKVYHINEDKFNALYLQRFNSDSSTHLNISLNNQECFYILNNEIINLIGKIYSIDKWCDQIFNPNGLPYSSKDYLISVSLLEEIKSSNKIEGIYSTRKELQELISIPTPKKYKRFYGMVNKYVKILNEEFPTIESSITIRNLYDEILLQDVVAEDKNDEPDGLIFRKNSVEISSDSKVIHHGITNEKDIIELMDKALKILNNEHINILIRVAVFHYLFEYIHPFYNGNGRMGRFLITGYLSKHLSILSSFQFSIACLHHSSKYYKAFKMTNDIRNKSDLTPFIIHFLEIYLSGLEELKDYLASTKIIYQNLTSKIKLQIEDKYQDFLTGLLEATLFSSSGLAMDELIKMSNKTEQTLRKHIHEINQQYAIIKIDKEHKPYKYAIDIDAFNHVKN